MCWGAGVVVVGRGGVRVGGGGGKKRRPPLKCE